MLPYWNAVGYDGRCLLGDRGLFLGLLLFWTGASTICLGHGQVYSTNERLWSESAPSTSSECLSMRN